MAQQGYFLSCRCQPEADLCLDNANKPFDAEIHEIQPLGRDVIGVRLRYDSGFSYRPGQFLTLIRSDGLARPYSIASLPEENELHLHVRVVPEGSMSTWLQADAAPGDAIKIGGPSGDCFYADGQPDQPMLLAGTGTGLAPLYGIARDALRQGHRGPVWLFHGAVDVHGLYLRQELQSIAGRYPQFRYVPAVLRGEAPPTVTVAPLDQLIAKLIPKLSGWRGFVCGNSDFVRTIKKQLFLAGMSSREIFADSFLPAVAAPAAGA